MLDSFLKKKLILLFLGIGILFSFTSNIFSENFYFFTRSTFAYSQFWERNIASSENNPNQSRTVVSNYFTGSVGVGFEFEIWDMGKKRGSRLFFKTGLDLVFSGIGSAAAYFDSTSDHTLYEMNINGGCFYTGVDWDLLFGGSFPKTDLIWGFGCIWTFLFPTYAPNYNVLSFYESYNFYASPFIMLGYDIFIPNTGFKITPQLRVGFTCNPLIPDDLLRDIEPVSYVSYRKEYSKAEVYSGVYIDFSVLFTFKTVNWKENK